MCGKGTNTTTQTSGPPAWLMPYYQQLFGRAQDASNIPYQQYTGQRVAGFTPDQQAAFAQLRGLNNQYLPQAKELALQGAGPLSTGAIDRYMSPYQKNVIDATMANIKENEGEQFRNVTGNAIAAGALGGDRAGIVKSELARQQGLAANQTLAGLQNQNYTQALGAAQADRAAAGQGAFALGNLNQVALGNIGAELGAGGMQQQLAQANLNVPYQNFLERRAYPFQQLNWLGGIMGLGGQMGGTSTTTPPQPNQFAQFAGLGLQALPFFLADGGAVDAPRQGFDLGGTVTPFSGGVYGLDPLHIQGGGGPPKPPQLLGAGAGQSNVGQMASSAINLAKMLKGSGFGSAQPMNINPMGDNQRMGMGQMIQPAGLSGLGLDGIYADGGAVLDMHRDPNGIYIPRGYDDGGGIPQSEFDDRWGDMPSSPGGDPAGSLGAAKGLLALQDVPQPAMDAWRAGNPGVGEDEGLPPQIAGPQPDFPQSAMAYDGSGPTGGLAAPPSGPPLDLGGAQPPPARGGLLSGLGLPPLSDAARMGLMSLGAGMMANRVGGPGSFLAAAGEGAQQGLQTYAKQQQAERQYGLQGRHVDLEAKKLAQAADIAAKRLELETQKLTETKRQHDVTMMQPRVLGQDNYGRPIYGVPDPKTGAMRIIDTTTGKLGDPITGPTVNRGQPTKPAEPNYVVPGVGPVKPEKTASAPEEDKGLPPNAVFTAGGEPSWVHPEVLQNLSPDDARLVKAIAEGRQKFLPTNRGSPPRNSFIMDNVRAYDELVDETAFGRRQKTTNAFSAGSLEGRNISSMNTWAKHVDSYLKLAKELDLGRFTTVNEIRNWLATHGFASKDVQDKVGALEVVSKAVADEGAKVFAGTNSALADREEWQKRFSPSNPYSVAVSKAKAAEDLVEGRLEALANQYNEGMRTNHNPQKFLTPETRAIIDRLKNAGSDYQSGPATGAPNKAAPSGSPAAPPSAAQPSAPPVGTVKGGYRFKGGDAGKKENWERVQ